ncbi:hypothetical protein BMS3Bbin13_00159 [bacterium BMS3Bbin13]|nr:hypothetical protein BMS3Bbin13_00159 [bacterium BMS3Bbin13]
MLLLSGVTEPRTPIRARRRLKVLLEVWFGPMLLKFGRVPLRPFAPPFIVGSSVPGVRA